MASRLTLVERTIKTRALRYVYSVSDPECFGGRLVTLVEYTECQVENAERYRWPNWFYQQPLWGIPLFLMLDLLCIKRHPIPSGSVVTDSHGVRRRICHG